MSVEQKNKLQQIVLNASEAHKHLLLNFPTGTGKTLAALKVAQHHNDLPWLILCKERTHINEWLKEIEKHNIDINYEIMCYQSLHKISGKYNVICDEAHALTVKRRNQIKKNISYDRILFLTATLPDNKYGHLNVLSNKEVFKLDLSLSKAISFGLLPQPQINVYFVSMDKKQSEKYKLIDNQVKSASWAFKLNPNDENYDKLMFLSNKRKDIISNFKLSEARKLITKLNNKGKRFICFTNSIKQLSWVTKSNSYIHSKQSTEKNAAVIKAFNDKKCNHLFTVKMLTESANLVDIEEGILIQLDKGKLTTIQRIGRVLRAYLPVMHIFVVKDTVDEGYLENSLQDIDQKYITYYEIVTKN